MLCRSCSTGCINCLNNTVCRNCSAAFFLYKDQCILSCPPGTYKSSNICLPCSSNCLTCSNASSCINCNSQFFLLPGLNASLTSCLTSCPLGYYPKILVQISFGNSTLTSFLQQQCTACVSPCLRCTSALTCTDCIANHTLSGFLCVANCPAGSYKSVNFVIQILFVSLSTTSCKLCSPMCATCVNSSTNCLTCPNGHILTSTNDCVSNCSGPSTFYNAVTRTCINCSVDCYTCFGTGSNNCLSCRPPLQWYQNSCYATCPFGFYSTPTFKC